MFEQATEENGKYRQYYYKGVNTFNETSAMARSELLGLTWTFLVTFRPFCMCELIFYVIGTLKLHYYRNEDSQYKLKNWILHRKSNGSMVTCIGNGMVKFMCIGNLAWKIATDLKYFTRKVVCYVRRIKW